MIKLLWAAMLLLFFLCVSYADYARHKEYERCLYHESFRNCGMLYHGTIGKFLFDVFGE